MSVVGERFVFVFCHQGCHTHPLCAVTTAEPDSRILVPHKHILLAAGIWSSLSHDSALTRKQQTETQRAEGGAELHYSTLKKSSACLTAD